MISLSTTDLKKYKKIASGKFGTIYQVDDDIAYKIYHKYVAYNSGIAEPSPNLFTPKAKLRRLIARNKKLIYTSLILDYIMVDGDFQGVVIKYYDGKTLNQLKDSSYQLKRDLSIQLLRNHRELLAHRIYPTDYHLDNIMVSNGEVKIIDLDDHFTYACILPHILLQRISTGELNATIRSFFSDSDHFHNPELSSLLEYEAGKYSERLDWLKGYLEARESIEDYLLIDINSDISRIKELLSNHTYRVLFVINYICNDAQIISDVASLRNNNIPIYDVLVDDMVDIYLSDYPVRQKVLVKGDNVYSD